MSNNIYKCKICGYTEDYVKLNGKITFIKKYELCRPCYIGVCQDSCRVDVKSFNHSGIRQFVWPVLPPTHNLFHGLVDDEPLGV